MQTQLTTLNTCYTVEQQQNILGTIEDFEDPLTDAHSSYTGVEAWFKAFVKGEEFDLMPSKDKARAFDAYMAVSTVFGNLFLPSPQGIYPV